MAPSVAFPLDNAGQKNIYADYWKEVWTEKTGHLSTFSRFASPGKFDAFGRYFIDAIQNKKGVTAGYPDNNTTNGSLSHLFPPSYQNTTPTQISIRSNPFYARTTQNWRQMMFDQLGGVPATFQDNAAYKLSNLYIAAVDIMEMCFSAPLDSDFNPIIGVAHSAITAAVTIADVTSGTITVAQLERVMNQTPYQIFRPAGTWPSKTYTLIGTVQVTDNVGGFGAGTITATNVTGSSITLASGDLLVPAYAFAASAAEATNTNLNAPIMSMLEWINSFTSGAAPRPDVTIAAVTDPSYRATKLNGQNNPISMGMIRQFMNTAAQIAPGLKPGQKIVPVILGGTNPADPQEGYVKAFDTYLGMQPELANQLLIDPNTKRRYNDITDVNDPGLGQIITLDGVPLFISFLNPAGCVVLNNASAWNFDFRDMAMSPGPLSGFNPIPETETLEAVRMFHCQEMLVKRNMTGLIYNVTGMTNASVGLA